MKGFLLDHIFKWLPPFDLVACMGVNKKFRTYASANAVWKRHKHRVLSVMPKLKVFESNDLICNQFINHLMGKNVFDTHNGVFFVVLETVFRNDDNFWITLHLAQFLLDISYIKQNNDNVSVIKRTTNVITKEWLLSFKKLIDDNPKWEEDNKNILEQIKTKLEI